MNTSRANSQQSFQPRTNNGSQSLRKAIMPVAAVFLLLMMSAIASAQVSVTATAGTVGPTPYTTVKLAFDAINAGTHQGAITINITANTTEGATPATLNSSGAGAASYTSVLIRPTADGVSISGNPVTGFGVIQLKGADNVTIDGDNPNTGGTNRNLTINNTTTNTVIANSVIRIANAAAVVTSSDNDTFKNLILNGNVTSGNASGITSTSGSSNSSFGIYIGGNGGATATDAPTAITSVTAQIIPAATTVNNLVIDNNSINQTARGIEFNGAATNNSNGVTISNNTIGSAANGAATGVYSMGMTVEGSTLVTIRSNTVYVESFLGTSVRAIDVGSISANVTGVTIEKNQVGRVWGNSTSGFGAYGINYQGGANATIQNNFVYNVNAFFNNGSISTTFGPHGIRMAATTAGHKLYHNSVNLFGPVLGQSALSMASSLTVVSSTQTGMDIRNNILVNTITGAPAGTPVDCIALPSGLTATFNLTDNNNAYYSSSQLGQSGTAAVSGFTVAGFVPSSTAGATNWRSYTSTLLTANTNNDNASFATSAAAPFTSSTDLHIPAATVTLLESGGATVGLLTDIDGDTRPNGTAPDIGADEFSGTAPPANDIAASAFVVPTNGATFANGSSTTPQASFSNVGTATQTNIGVQFTISGPGGYAYTDNQVIASLAGGASTTVTFVAAPAFSTIGAYTMSAAVTTADSNPANDVINGGFTVANPLSGSYNVPGDFPSLTNNGGIFQAINSLGASGNLTININGDLVGETGTNPLNEIAGGFTVTIKPSGAARTITGSSAVSLIKLSGVDNVTIDGSLAGGTDRSLTLNNTGAGTIVWIATNATSGANSDTVKNCIITGPGGFVGQGFITGSGATFGNPAEFPQSNNTIQNNAVSGVQNAAFISGAATLDQNWIVTDNTFGSATVANKLSFRGVIIINGQNLTISNNTISGVSSSTGTSSTMSGIQVAGVINGGTISRNFIRDIKQNNTTGWGSNGIYLTASSTTSNLTISNNFVSDVASQGFNDVTSADNGYGIMIDTGGGYNIWHNTVDLNTNQGAGAASGITAALNIAAAVTTAGSIDLRDNVLADTETLGTRYGVIDSSTAGAAIFTDINYNDYFAQNVGFLTAAQATLANWQTATGKDANSKAVDPIFVSSTDLHLQPASTLLSQGTSPALVANDIDNDPRPTVPDIGADELVQATGGSIAAGTYYNVSAAPGDSLGGNVTVTNVVYLNGILNAGANTLTIDCNGTVSGAGPTSYITGNLQKNYCGTGVKGFEVGTANAYSPVSVNATAGTFPSNFTVKAVQGPQPNVNAATSLQRYWTLTEGGDITANLNFNYNDPLDIAGTESDYHLIRVSGGTPAAFPNNCPTPGANQACVDFAGNQAAINGVSNFSDWTLGTVSGPTAAPATISGRITTTSGAPLGGVSVRLGGARNALAMTDAQGNYRFANVDTDNFYTVTPSITNYHFSPSSRSFSLLANMTDAVFTGTLDSSISGNVIDTPEYFVRQHYLDFLGREPDDAGLNFWSAQIRGCNNDYNCIERRTINVSAAYFLSIEFQATGGLVDGLYRASYGRAPRYAEFMPDTARVAHNVIVNQSGWEGVLATNKTEFLNAWVERPEFHAAYDNLTNDGYVDALIGHTGVTFTDAERATLVNGLSNNTLTRAQALRQVAENERFASAKFNEAFVRMEYFGYLRRDPDDAGFHFWLQKLNDFDGNFERAEMVKAFIVSGEYRARFVQ
jgi:hypothetical protein